MVTRYFEFSVNVGSGEHKEIIEFEFDKDKETKDDLESEVQEAWEEWSNQLLDGGWEEVDEEGNELDI